MEIAAIYTWVRALRLAGGCDSETSQDFNGRYSMRQVSGGEWQRRLLVEGGWQRRLLVGFARDTTIRYSFASAAKMGYCPGWEAQTLIPLQGVF